MSNNTSTWRLVLGAILMGVTIAIFMGVGVMGWIHPDMTARRLLIEYWHWYAAGFGCAGAALLCWGLDT